MTEETKKPQKLEQEASDDEFRVALNAALDASESDVTAGDREGSSTLISLDSLQGNEFHVELEGQPITGVFRVDGLTSFRLTDDGLTTTPVVVAKMVQRDATLPFNRWLRETVEGGSPENRPTRKLEVVAVDDGDETRRWTLHDAYITSVSYNTFDTSSSDLVEETITVAYKTLTEKWTWSDGQ